MPSSVGTLLHAAGLSAGAVVPWGSKPALNVPGVYVVALSVEPDAVEARQSCPLEDEALDELLRARPELRLDGRRPTKEELAERLSAMWLPDETVLYIGMAGSSVSARVTAYFRTPLGARSPHAGGWPLKTLSILRRLYVHCAATSAPAESEGRLTAIFVGGVDPAAAARTVDPELPLPFANLRFPAWPRKEARNYGRP